MDKIRVGISACLLGEPVRYDGGHKLDRFLRDTLGRYVEYVPVCPEVECGFGVPRESMRLMAGIDGPRLVTSRSGVDHMDRMYAWVKQRVKSLTDVVGFIFKSESPSSGMERVKVYGKQGISVRNGVGIFAAAFMRRLPLIPVEDDGRLHDPSLRENFIERLFTLKRWRETASSPGVIVEFHSTHKLLILAHSPRHYQALGRLVARSGEMDSDALHDQYQQLLMEALKLKATPAKHANVLQHMLGYFKRHLTPAEKQELLEIIDLHRRGILPLIVPVTLLQHSTW